jgi:hypothetical protein
MKSAMLSVHTVCHVVDQMTLHIAALVNVMF